ncbi:MAG: glycosyltransferase family 2 protein, partial [Gaiellaceae bacterium]
AKGRPVSDVSIIIVSYNTREYLARSLGVVAGGPHEVVVVDNASTDGSPAFVRERFPSVRLLELTENRGFGAGNNAGMEEATGRWLLLLNSDAWPVGDAVERLVAYGEAHARAGIVGPRLRNPDGSLQRSVRGHPTLWRLATEYLFLRRLAPRTRLLNAFYGAGFDHAQAREVEVLKGAVLLVRREAAEAVGSFDPAFFMYGEEMDLCYRARRAGWAVVFTPEAEFVHVGGVSTGARWGETPAFGPMFREQLRSHMRFLAKHHGPVQAERARRLLLASLRLRALLFRGERGRTYRQAAEWLASADAGALLESPG